MANLRHLLHQCQPGPETHTQAPPAGMASANELSASVRTQLREAVDVGRQVGVLVHRAAGAGAARAAAVRKHIRPPPRLLPAAWHRQVTLPARQNGRVLHVNSGLVLDSMYRDKMASAAAPVPKQCDCRTCLGPERPFSLPPRRCSPASCSTTRTARSSSSSCRRCCTWANTRA